MMKNSPNLAHSKLFEYQSVHFSLIFLIAVVCVWKMYRLPTLIYLGLIEPAVNG